MRSHERRRQARAQQRLRPDQMYADGQVATGKNRASYLGLRSFVRAHGVESDVGEHRALALLGFLYFQNFAALIGSRIWGRHGAGSLRSWQFGHSESPLAVRASCARRVEVRAFEWRRFGFGIADSFRSRQKFPGKNFSDSISFVSGLIRLRRSESAVHRAIGRCGLAGAGFGVQIASAARAKSLAVRAAKRSYREG